MQTLLRASRPILLALTLGVPACGKQKGATPEDSTLPSKVDAGGAAGIPKATAEGHKDGLDADALRLPHDLGRAPVVAENAQSKEKVVLGQQLFFDKRLSADGSRSCYSCHTNQDGNGGHDPVAIGANGKKLTRHSPVIWNVAYAHQLSWDGRFDALEAQATAALAGGNMGVGKEKLAEKAQQLSKIKGYKQAFELAFPGKGVTPETIAQALSAYERTLICDATTYDRYAKGEKAVLTAEQKRGLSLFMGKAGCSACHAPPFFSTAFLTSAGVFFNTGVGTQGKKDEEVDVGRMGVTKAPSDWAAFKPPSLRNVSRSAPYFHDGSVPTLKEAVRFMASGGAKNKNLTPLMRDQKLSEQELEDIVAFLGTLDCGKALEEPKLP